MNNYKSFQELKSIKYTLEIFVERILNKKYDISYILSMNNRQEYFKTQSKVKMKMHLDLLGIDHFDELRMFPNKKGLKIAGFDKRFINDIRKHTEFQLIKYYD